MPTTLGLNHTVDNVAKYFHYLQMLQISFALFQSSVTCLIWPPEQQFVIFGLADGKVKFVKDVKTFSWYLTVKVYTLSLISESIARTVSIWLGNLRIPLYQWKLFDICTSRLLLITSASGYNFCSSVSAIFWYFVLWLAWSKKIYFLLRFLCLILPLLILLCHLFSNSSSSTFSSSSFSASSSATFT